MIQFVVFGTYMKLAKTYIVLVSTFYTSRYIEIDNMKVCHASLRQASLYVSPGALGNPNQ